MPPHSIMPHDMSIVRNRRRFLGASILGLTLPQLAGQRNLTSPQGVSLLLLRHAEKASDHPQDPTLSSVGQSRAVALDQLLAAITDARVFCTDFRRTRETVAPFVARLKIEPTIYAADQLPTLMEALGDSSPGALQVVVGHSNTTPVLAKELGLNLPDLDSRGFFTESQYNRLIFVTALLAPENGKLRATGSLELRYSHECV